MKEPHSKKQKVSPDTHKMKLSNPMILKYWKVPGRGEAIRVMLHVAKGAKWQNQYIGFETWGEEKKIAPLGCLPTLKMFDDPNIPPFCQSTALARYAAKQAGYYPNNDLDALIVDEVLETINELTSLLPSEEDRDEKKVKRAEFQAKTMTTYAELLESRIKTFGEGKRVVKSGWTVADGEFLDPNALSQQDP